jgi:hypothetical protein
MCAQGYPVRALCAFRVESLISGDVCNHYSCRVERDEPIKLTVHTPDPPDLGAQKQGARVVMPTARLRRQAEGFLKRA